jgi:hypothetical protein
MIFGFMDDEYDGTKQTMQGYDRALKLQRGR